MDRTRVTLAVWERLSATRDLQAFLTAVAKELAPIVSLHSIGALGFAPDAGFRLLAAWDAQVPNAPGETADDLHRRTVEALAVPLPARRRVPYDDEVFARLGAGTAVSCADLLAKDTWYEYEFALAASGVRTYTSLPVFIEGQLTGLAVFTRRHAKLFLQEETQILTDAARAIGVAIARALADEELARVRDRLREDAPAPELRLGHAPF